MTSARHEFREGADGFCEEPVDCADSDTGGPTKRTSEICGLPRSEHRESVASVILGLSRRAAECDRLVADLYALRVERDQLAADLDQLAADLHDLRAEREQLAADLHDLRAELIHEREEHARTARALERVARGLQSAESCPSPTHSTCPTRRY